MDNGAQDANTPVAREILSYFLRNPEAADSLMEIARWRPMQQTVQHSVEATSAALNLLLAEGYLDQQTRPGIDRIYSLNTDRREAAEKFLRKEQNTSNDPQ